LLKFNEPVLSWEAREDAVHVVTASTYYRASRLLIAAGAWVSSLLNPAPLRGSDPAPFLNNPTPDLRVPLFVERQVLFWFDPGSQAEQFQPRNCPIYIWEYEPERFFYGFPDVGDGVKVAFHHQGEITDPEHLRREVSANEIETMRSLLLRFLPAAAGHLRSEAVCMYTNTPDEHFIFDRHPMHQQVLVASPCSGHGFKFSSVIGELAANLLTGSPAGFDLSRFKIGRFAQKVQVPQHHVEEMEKNGFGGDR